MPQSAVVRPLSAAGLFPFCTNVQRILRLMSNNLPLPVYLSLGAGVQSSTMALMAAAGELTPMPEGAIFADTQHEPAEVYRWLDWLERELPYPVHRVTKGSLAASALDMRVTADGRRFSKKNIPFFTLNKNGSKGMMRFRDCTVDYKIRPILKALRQLAKVKRGTKTPVVESWIGITTDEFKRMKPSRDLWVVNRWPLIEKRLSRADCLTWMGAKGYPTPPRSACVFCPFHSDAEWGHMKQHDPESFAEAVDFEKKIQEAKGPGAVPFLHASRRPLDEVSFSGDDQQLRLWDDECEGMCGV